MQMFTGHQLRHSSGVGALDDTLLGHDRVDQVRWRHIEHRIERLDIRADPLPADFKQLAAIALLDENVMKRTPWCIAATASW